MFPVFSNAQNNLPDSLRKIFFSSKDDSINYKAASHLYDFYEEVNRDSAFFYAGQCVQISERNNKKLNEAFFLNRKAYQELNMGKYAESLNNLLKAFELSENKANDKLYWSIGTFRPERDKRLYVLACTHHIYGILMLQTLNKEQEIIHFKEAKRIAVEINSLPDHCLQVLILAGSIFSKETLILLSIMKTKLHQLRKKQAGKNIYHPFFIILPVLIYKKATRMAALVIYTRVYDQVLHRIILMAYQDAIMYWQVIIFQKAIKIPVFIMPSKVSI